MNIRSETKTVSELAIRRITSYENPRLMTGSEIFASSWFHFLRRETSVGSVAASSPEIRDWLVL